MRDHITDDYICRVPMTRKKNK